MPIGPGVERITEEAEAAFPDARLLVMASDTLTGPQDAAEPGWQHRPAIARSGPLARLGNEAARRNREVPWAPPESA